MRTTAAAALSLCLALGGLAAAQLPRGSGYLDPATRPDTLKVLPPPPAPGSAQDLADQAIFRQSRALEGSPRWALAVHDVDLSAPAMMDDFSCALGVLAAPASAPRLASLIARLGPDIAAAVDPPKKRYQRPRPYLRDRGDICVAKTDALARNYDYPSGHAAWSWTIGLVLAELAPGRSGAILERARAFGDSRVVCGVHNASSVAAGRMAASALFAALNAQPAFRGDLAGAREEVAALRASGPRPDPTRCAAEQALVGKAPW
ncbi:MAG: phosphatase PAP2 family protein [Caulobacteraceae bacterium]|nr:phosphatase PAP2 family protein [Caulobacteraceae bacterium]